MKKKILVITYDKAAALYHAREVQALLGLKGTVIGCSVQDILEAPLPQADLYCITTDAVEKIPDFQAQFPSSDQIVYFFVAFSYEAIQKLREVPDGTKALFVNLNEKMALECITSLSQLGINQILFSPYYPGAALDGTDQFPLAVTPDEERYIPDGIQQVINVGQRKMDCNTLVEILLKLKFYDLLESPKSRIICPPLPPTSTVLTNCWADQHTWNLPSRSYWTYWTQASSESMIEKMYSYITGRPSRF